MINNITCYGSHDKRCIKNDKIDAKNNSMVLLTYAFKAHIEIHLIK